MPLAVVTEEITAADRRHVQIGITVVVVVAHGDSLAVERLVEAGFFRDVCEASLAVVAIESLGRLRIDLVAGPVRRIDEEQVLVAVAVVIDKGHARAHRLGQELVAKAPFVWTNVMPASLVISTNLTVGNDSAVTATGRTGARALGRTGVAVPGLHPKGKTSKSIQRRCFAS